MVCLLVERVDQSGEEASFAFLCGAVTALSATQPGVEQVSHRVAEHVEGVDDNRQEDTGPESQPRRHLHVQASFPAEHATPAGYLEGQPVSEEAQRRLGNDNPANVDRENDDDKRHDFGQDMPDQDMARGSAHRPGGQKVVILFNAHHGASDDSGAADASGDPQHHDDLEEPLSHDGHDGQQEQQSRKGHPGIDKALRSQVHFPPKESGSAADQGCDEHIQRRRGQTDS